MGKCEFFIGSNSEDVLEKNLVICRVFGRYGEVKLGGLENDVVLGFIISYVIFRSRVSVFRRRI